MPIFSPLYSTHLVQKYNVEAFHLKWFHKHLHCMPIVMVLEVVRSIMACSILKKYEYSLSMKHHWYRAFAMMSLKLTGCHFGAQLNSCRLHGMSALSNYTEKLLSEAKQRYRTKLLLIDGVDPFCISGKSYRESNLLLSNLFVSVEKLS